MSGLSELSKLSDMEMSNPVPLRRQICRISTLRRIGESQYTFTTKLDLTPLDMTEMTLTLTIDENGVGKFEQVQIGDSVAVFNTV